MVFSTLGSKAVWREYREIVGTLSILEEAEISIEGPLYALGPQPWAGPDEGYCVEALSLSRTAVLSRQGQAERRVGSIPTGVLYGEGTWVGRDTGA